MITCSFCVNPRVVVLLQKMETQMKLMVASRDFEQHTANAFSRLHTDVDSSDVTLVADDMTKFPAHRIVLSVSSPFFASLLQAQNKQPGHALLFLGGLSRDLLQALVSFIYLGKVEVEEQHMDCLLYTSPSPRD